MITIDGYEYRFERHRFSIYCVVNEVETGREICVFKMVHTNEKGIPENHLGVWWLTRKVGVDSHLPSELLKGMSKVYSAWIASLVVT